MKCLSDNIAARSFLEEALTLIREGVIEDVLRQRFAACLPKIFPSEPWWVEYHSLGAESHVRFEKKGKNTGGFVDSLVGLTAIEYEKNLSIAPLFSHGLGQVEDYCAGLLNEGHPQDHIIGVLSDTVSWHAYQIDEVADLDQALGEIYGRNHIKLVKIESIELVEADDRSANQLVNFLSRYLGREGTRPLQSTTLAHDLGFESEFCERHISRIQDLVQSAFLSNTKYAHLIEKLWRDFVTYLGDTDTAGRFDQEVYARELYLLTLAKLLCANVIAREGLVSSDHDICSILNGDHFKLKGLTNLVEYDYFGWLNDDPYVHNLIPVAKEIQDDLRAYDFKSPPIEDFFGAMMAQLARRSQRLLLGQEWTPTWLAASMVGHAFRAIPEGEVPRLIDMCCGSGAMVVEAVKCARNRLDEMGTKRDASYVSQLVHTISGFDIDPLAVMLAKVGWVIAARECLEPLGNYDISIPIYHADSLFATTPLLKETDDDKGRDCYELVLDDQTVNLPGFLISPESRFLFDALLNSAYEVAMSSARLPSPDFTEEDLLLLIRQSEEITSISLEDTERVDVLGFCRELVSSLDMLQRDGRNGIWAFVLRNSYRPGLMSGLFNGLVSNPPWLALSKIADNPYKDVLKDKAEGYQIKPPSSSHLHIELATIFLLHAIDHYVSAGGVVSCILPETVLNGHHHEPFRKGSFRHGEKSVQLGIDELWRVEKGTFKNEAIVLLGKKEKRVDWIQSPLSGFHITPTDSERISFNKLTHGKREVWSDIEDEVRGQHITAQSSTTMQFFQGADIMPRTLIFHEVKQASSDRWMLGPIDRQRSELRYLIKGAKKHVGFSLPECVISDKFIFDVLLSNHLTPFDLWRPAKACLPIVRGDNRQWEPITPTGLAAQSTAKHVFDRVFAAAGPEIGSVDFFNTLNERQKLSKQTIPAAGYLVLMGAGGDYVCATYANIEFLNADKLIVDQTLYWTVVDTEDEAVYLTGVLGSDAVNTAIKEFQPRGQFGPRHVHMLPVRITPKYDSTDKTHVAIVKKTRLLFMEWYIEKRENPAVKGLLDPNKALPQRRRKLRDAIRHLQSYQDYHLACEALALVGL